MSAPKKQSRRWRVSAFFSAFPFMTFFSMGGCFAQTTDGALESQVKAAYIYNFTKFIYWDTQKNDSSTSPIGVAMLDAGPIGDILETFSKKQTGGRPLVVRKLKTDSLDIADCRVVFIGQFEKKWLPALFKKLDGTNILTVSDISGFTRQGGMIGFFIEDGRVRIEINMDAVQDAELKISAKLLEVAKIISLEK